MRDQSQRPYEGHLLLAVTRIRLHVHQQAVLTEFARETDQPLPGRGATAGGDALRLRGVPCVGRGVGGAIRGTRPEDALQAVDRHLKMRGFAALVRDIDGTSPGTQPEDELMRRQDDLLLSPSG